ncbi:MAG: Uma2 family endonuclease [Bacteroidota bacterium]
MGEPLEKEHTVKQWVDLMQETGIKYDYHNGRLYRVNDMAGGSKEHNRLSKTILGELYASTQGGDCEVHNSDTAIVVDQGEKYVFPDVSVTCGEIDFSEKFTGAINNPVLVIEVLSNSTAGYDKNDKLKWYFELQSVKEYLLLYQTKAGAILFRRLEKESQYEIHHYLGLESEIELKSIGQTLPMRKVYEKVTFDPSHPE